MIRAETKTKRNDRKVKAEVQKGAFENMGHAARSISKDAKKSIRSRRDPDKASPEGDPPFTHRGAFFRRAIRWYVAKDGSEVLVGFAASIIGQVGATHEHGLREQGRDYPQRPTMGPAFQRAIPRIGGRWQGSIGR